MMLVVCVFALSWMDMRMAEFPPDASISTSYLAAEPAGQGGVPAAFAGPAGAKAKTRSRVRELPKTDIDKAVRDFVMARAPEIGVLHLERVVIPNLRGIPAGKLTYQIRMIGNRGLIGRRSLYVDVMVNDRVHKTVSVRIETSLELTVAVAKTDLTRGEAIGQQRVEWETRRLDRIDSPPVTPGQFESLQSRTMIRAGTILTARLVETIPLVLRNAPVLVVAKRGPLRVRMKGLALDAGAIGDVIRVKNTDSGQILHAQIQKNGDVLAMGF